MLEINDLQNKQRSRPKRMSFVVGVCVILLKMAWKQYIVSLEVTEDVEYMRNSGEE